MAAWGEEDPDIPDDDDLRDGLERLLAVEHFGARLAAVPWFTHLGQPLLRDERALARTYLDALGFAEAELVPVHDWEEAAFAAETPASTPPGGMPRNSYAPRSPAKHWLTSTSRSSPSP